MFQLLVLCGLVAVAVAQTDSSGCCAPDQWEGLVREISSVKARFGYGKYSGEIFTLSYDLTNQRVRQDVSYQTGSGDGRANLAIILNYRTQKAYVIKSGTQSCTVYHMRSKLQGYCVPSNAKFFSNLFYQTERGKFWFTAYGFRINERRTYIAATVTRETCLPIQETVTTPRQQGRYVGIVNYANITPGIKDPSVFNPPRFCQRGAMDFEEADIEPMGRFLPDYINNRIMGV